MPAADGLDQTFPQLEQLDAAGLFGPPEQFKAPLKLVASEQAEDLEVWMQQGGLNRVDGRGAIHAIKGS